MAFTQMFNIHHEKYERCANIYIHNHILQLFTIKFGVLTFQMLYVRPDRCK